MNDSLWNKKTFCPLPWNSIYLQPDGEIDSCCVSKNNLGNINKISIEQAVFGAKNIEIKNQISNNIVPEGCKVCHPINHTREEFDHDVTLKEWYKKLLKNGDRKFYNKTENFELKYFDLRLKNTCNFGCVYCGPALSSVREIEEIGLPIVERGITSDTINQPIIKIAQNKIDSVYRFFEKHAHTLEVLYLAGGEPLYIKENIHFLEKLYEVNPNCEIRVNTNLSLINENKIFESIMKFKNTFWTVSVDDMHERFNYIRYKGNWNIFLNNLLKLKELVSVHKIAFSMVFCSLNAKTIFECIEFLLSKDFIENHVSVRYINNGHGIVDAWDPKGLPKKYLDEVIQLIELKEYKSPNLNQQIRHIESILKLPYDESLTYSVFKSFERFDSMRNLDSKTIFPEIYEYRK